MNKRVFVAQPFHDPYDRRFDDTYKPAIERAGFEAYRVDRDPAVSIPIDDIESGIKSSAFLFADISEDNPNVWFEVGYGIAVGKEICFVCSRERMAQKSKFPFDIQHRSIIEYYSQSARDWQELEKKIVDRIVGIVSRGERRQEIQKTLQDRTPPSSGRSLTDFELAALAIVASAFPSEEGLSAYEFKSQMQSSGFNDLASNLTLRKLKAHGLIHAEEVHSQYDNEPHTRYFITEEGWAYVEGNRAQFIFEEEQKSPSGRGAEGLRDLDDEIPF
ncbi:hypothetical protein VSX64_02075 [Aurantimonas sp. C2-6-R+9]|uniref:hypothetical protein n=1 Tax=unclassified Aurantimonas TaxID=2638230 RepID=UPI002E16C5C4|nr:MULTISPECIES: hypothetical protein [unclassified Aurantimonas]MEC5289711.1 hypothetical protein [Aurantimonas sp. C2-3-R2]MEC5379677.1 hypothetical protein [Aurantimonas sp. C2-6-R+9]MEC5410852.1 hypothetical protein [Aurantimonas sp. C2-4-R8]